MRIERNERVVVVVSTVHCDCVCACVCVCVRECGSIGVKSDQSSEQSIDRHNHHHHNNKKRKEADLETNTSQEGVELPTSNRC